MSEMKESNEKKELEYWVVRHAKGYYYTDILDEEGNYTEDSWTPYLNKAKLYPNFEGIGSAPLTPVEYYKVNVNVTLVDKIEEESELEKANKMSDFLMSLKSDEEMQEKISEAILNSMAREGCFNYKMKDAEK